MNRNAWISVVVLALALALAGCEAPPTAPAVTLRIALYQSIS